MKKMQKYSTAVVIIIAVLAGLYFPIKTFIDGDLQETVVVMEKESAVGTDAPVRIIVRHRKYNLPIENSEVTLSLRPETGNLIPIGKFKTNNCGTINEQIQLNGLEAGKYSVELQVKSFLGQDRLKCPFMIYQPKELVISTSKPLYRPGEILEMRSFLRNPQSQKPLKGEEVKYEIIDSKGNIIFRKEAKTSEYGLSAVSCPLSTVLNHGKYTVKASTKGVEEEKTVDIKNYSLPKFKVNFQTLDPFCLPGNTIHGKLNVEYYFGEKVRNARFSIRAVSFYEGGTIPVDIEKNVLQEGFTDKKGFAKTHFFPPEACDRKSGLLVLEITVSDQAGNQVSTKKSVSISDRKINLTVLPEAGILVPGLKNRIFFLTTRTDGTPIDCRVKIDDITGRTLTDGMGMLTYCPSKLAKNVKVTAYLPGWASDTKTLSSPEKPILPAIIRSNKAIYTDDKNAIISVTSSEKLNYIFFDVMSAGGLKKQLSFNMEGKEYQRFDIPLEGVRGEVKITGYIVDGKGNHRSSSTYFFVKPDKGLVVDVTKNKEVYKPGDNVTLGVALKDKQGAPIIGAVSINIADEKLLSFAGGNFNFFSAALLNNDSEGITYLADSAGEMEQIKARILLLKKAQVKPKYKDVIQMLVEEELINQEVVDQARQFIEGQGDLSHLNPELREIAEKMKGEVSPVATFATGSKKESAARRRWDSIKSVVGTLSMILSIAAFIIFLIVKLGRKIVQVFVVLIIIALLAAMLLPALSMARCSARKISAMNNLKQIGLSMRMASDAGVDLKQYEIESSRPSGKKIKVRNYFPETLYWNPEAVTDENGKLDIQFQMADSMTSWRGIFDAVDSRGELASKSVPIKTFQEFFVEIDSPNEMLLNDEVSVPVTCHNYLKQQQKIKLLISASSGLYLEQATPRTLLIEPEGVETIYVPVTGKALGVKKLKVIAVGDKSSDAMESEIRILPSGNKVTKSEQAILDSSSSFNFTLPNNAIPGSGQVVFKSYPNTLSEATEGLASMFRQPYGCFEQTSSTTYPNVMIIRYLKSQKQASTALERKAKTYIQTGYQRLLTFEVEGGGFSLYGRNPASVHLTAYGVLEFTDMAKVIYVDPDVIKRAKAFLFSKKRTDGSWNNDVVETAYVAWALAESGDKSPELKAALNYLYKKYNSQDLTNYTKALTAIAMLKVNSRDTRGKRIAGDLVETAIIEKGEAYWRSKGRTVSYSRGKSQHTIVTALCTVALQTAGINSPLRYKALKWITTNKSSNGGWGTTQATLLAIRALLNDKPVCNLDRDTNISIALNGNIVKNVSIKKENSDMVRIVDLSSFVTPGNNKISMKINKGSQFPYLISGSYWMPDNETIGRGAGLLINQNPYRNSLRVGENLYCKLSVSNKTSETVYNPIIKIGIPAGFSPDMNKFNEMVKQHKIEKYEFIRGEIVLYLDRLSIHQTFKCEYAMKARMKAVITMPKAEIYEYYNPANRAFSKQETITVEGK